MSGMNIRKSVTIGEQFGSVEYDEGGFLVNITNLKGRILLPDLEVLVRTARDLDRRVNGTPAAERPAPVAKPGRKK
jgi:hypothetical protein